MMRTPQILFAALMLLLVQGQSAATQVPGTPPAPGSKIIAGYIENAWIGEPPIKIEAKLDTGADNSSINAPTYREFNKGGQTYVSFQLSGKDGRAIDIERPIVRKASIKRAGVSRSSRPVITLKTCVAGVTSEVEFTMSDRTTLSYQVLIGRTFLADKILVASDRTFLRSELCKN